MKPIEQAAQECANKTVAVPTTGCITQMQRHRELIAAAMREVCEPLERKLAESNQAFNVLDGVRSRRSAEANQLRAALDVAEGALNDILETNWVSTVDEAMRGGNTPVCAAESMHTTAGQALARIAEARKDSPAVQYVQMRSTGLTKGAPL